MPSHRCGHYPSTRVVFQVESILIPTVYISTGVPPAYSPIHAGVIHSEYQPVRGSCHSPRGRLSLLQSRKRTAREEMFIIQMIERGYRHPDEMWYPRYLWI
nr:MAG TPA: hypothetical protein [Caudoviricetes sp.]